MPFAETSEPTGQRPMHWHWGAALALLGVAGAVQAQTPPLSIDETFRNATAPGWSLLGPVAGTASDPAVLTAAPDGMDAPGEGWLRLTKAAAAQAGTALYKQAFSSSKGVDVSFQYATWGTNSGRGGDGFTFYLIDGAEADPVVGARGGSLGYSWGNYGAGVKSGYVGIGFDEYGNFSDPTFGVCALGPNVTACERLQHRVAVRGSGHLLGFAPGDAQNKSTGFKLLHNKMPMMPPPDTTIFTGSRADAKNVRIVITPAPEVKLTVILEGQTIVDQLPLTQANGNPVDGMAALPATFKMGFSSSTGGAINHHEIRNLTVRQAQLEATPDDYSTPYGQKLEVAAGAPNALGANDLGILPGAVYSLEGQATGGTATVNADGSFSFEPAADFAGNATFTYKVCNQPATNPANCKTALATVIVGPNAQPDEATTTMGQPANGDLKANDTAPASATYKLRIVPHAAQGTATVNADGTYTFTPAAGFSGNASFTYEVCSGPGGTAPCAEATVNVKVNPKATADSYSTTLNTALPADASRNLGANDDKPNNAKFSLVPSSATNGTATVEPDGTFSFTPAQGFVGDATFSYKVCNEAGTHCSEDTTVTVKVGAAAPQVADDSATTTVGQPANGNLKDNDTVPAGATYKLKTAPNAAQGTATVNADGTYTFTPAAGFSGDASFIYEVCSGPGGTAPCAQATVTIKVNPKATADSYSTAPNAELPADPSRNLGANDDKPNNAKFSLVPGSATNGTATVNPDGTFSFKPDQDFVGDATFSYKVCNEAGTHCSADTTVTIKVSSAPVAQPDEFTVAPGQPIQGDVKGNDVVPAGAVFSLVPSTPVPDPATQGTLVFNNDGTFTFTPVQGFTGTVDFEYQMCAGPGGTAPCVRASVRLNVQAIVLPSTVPVPALNLWSLLGLSALLGVFGLRRRQRQ